MTKICQFPKFEEFFFIQFHCGVLQNTHNQSIKKTSYFDIDKGTENDPNSEILHNWKEYRFDLFCVQF